MGRPKKRGRDISGIVILDKPLGESSNRALQRVKRLFNANRAGHTGSLDPLATGVLPICLGEATKLSHYLLEADKTYQVTCQLGTATDTGDVEGKVVHQQAIPEFDANTLKDVLSQFLGEQQQVPPMFSALKHQGEPLYKLARQGIEVERKSRLINIYDIELLDLSSETFSLSVSCSKGTYIRTLIEDISQQLGTCGHVTFLRRTQAAQYHLEQAVSLAELEQFSEQGLQALDEHLQPLSNALLDWPTLYLDKQASTQIGFGQTIRVDTPFVDNNVRLFNEKGVFFGLGMMSPEGEVKPKRLFVQDETE